jgi:hypothetical protein
MSICDVPWIDHPGYWFKDVRVGSIADEVFTLSVGSMITRDGTFWFNADVKPSAVCNAIGKKSWCVTSEI